MGQLPNNVNKFNNIGVTSTGNWFNSGDTELDASINKVLSHEFDNSPDFKRALEQAVMGPSVAEALFDKKTAPEFAKNPNLYNETIRNQATNDFIAKVNQILTEQGITVTPDILYKTVDKALKDYAYSPDYIPYKASTLTNDITSFASYSNLLKRNPNDPTLPGYWLPSPQKQNAVNFSFSSHIAHIVQRMGGRKLTDNEYQELSYLTNKLQQDLEVEEYNRQFGNHLPFGNTNAPGAPFQGWQNLQDMIVHGADWLSGGQLTTGVQARQDTTLFGIKNQVTEDKNNLKDFFTKVLSTPGELLLPPPPTATPTYASGVPVPTSPVATAPLTPDYSTLLANNPETPRFNINSDGTVSTFNWSKLLNPTTTVESTETPTTPVPVETPVVPSKVSNTPKAKKIIPTFLQNDPAITGSVKQEVQGVPPVQPQSADVSGLPVPSEIYWLGGAGLGAGAGYGAYQAYTGANIESPQQLAEILAKNPEATKGINKLRYWRTPDLPNPTQAATEAGFVKGDIAVHDLVDPGLNSKVNSILTSSSDVGTNGELTLNSKRIQDTANAEITPTERDI